MKIFKVLPLLLCFMLLSCDDVFECMIGRNPSLPNKQFPIGTTEGYYYVDLSAEIKNEPRDNDYDYYFHVEGLPLGMDYFVNYRTISLEGTPEETGVFEITIYLDVDGPFRNNFDDDPDLLCNYSTSKSYTLVIE
ncbi:hypothetical protein [Winogradskyella aquimaris]|uniref:DUF4377 domain-containing protein n=1 Tax=Winogradskyella aquimaris TaxID=864074 RepID=A0ABU5EMD8_9FLAO|nr:hypothetical protein [Winogradskyella aquimaris]MDY2587616.1 hypothetical protein [Winogradskyella aquimaris]